MKSAKQILIGGLLAAAVIAVAPCIGRKMNEWWPTSRLIFDDQDARGAATTHEGIAFRD
jgi:hypothetical protein